MASTEGWEIVSRDVRQLGTYFRLNLRGKGNQGAITVKARVGIGEPYVCLTCDASKANRCAHVQFVRDHDTGDANEMPTPATEVVHA